MNPPPTSESLIYQHSAELLAIHDALLRDETRNRAFAAALERHVTPESVVLDIGSGTGLWAILAAKLGARRVVAVEREGLMCGAIKALCRANGVADRVEVIHGEAMRVELPREFDIVVSETVGHLIFDEQIVSLMIDARERLLKPGGAMIPEQVALVAAPLHLGEAPRSWPAGIDLNYGPFEELALHRPQAFTDKSRFECLAAPCELVRSDLREAAACPDLTRLAAGWNIPDARRLDGVAVWVEMFLTSDIVLSTLETPSWSATVYRFAPFPSGSGRLDFQLELNAGTNHWSGSLGGRVQRFSPAIAATRLALQQNVDAELLPHLPIHGGGALIA